MTKFFDKLTALGFLLLLLLLFVWVVAIKPPDTVIEERRASHPAPSLSSVGLADGSYLAAFEAYLADAIPCRSLFYRLHTAISTEILQNPTCHGIRREKDGLEKVLAAYDGAFIRDNLSIIERYVGRLSENSRVYGVLIPDKGAYTRDDADYRGALRLFEDCPWLNTLDCYDALTVDDYFYGDIHIRPERYGTLAETLSAAMGLTPTADPSVAGYVSGRGTLALQYPADVTDSFCYLDDASGVLSGLLITAPDGSERLLYDIGAAYGDPYDLYLGGERGNGILRVQNPSADPNKRLIVFRDSFMRAFLPYLASHYGEILLVDLRAGRNAILSSLDDYRAIDCDILVFLSTHTLFSTRF